MPVVDVRSISHVVFFSSRRRHTRFDCDWSSDVCSSDLFLQLIEQDTSDSIIVAVTNHGASLDTALFRRFDDVIRYATPDEAQVDELLRNRLARSEERRVGKEWRSRWSAYH